MKCYNCIFKSIFRDMGASCDVCTLFTDLAAAIHACEHSENCICFLSREDAKEILLNEIAKRGSSKS